MKPEIKARWVAALRSGDYKQGFNMLHDSKRNGYCCLGVLCEIAVKDGVITKQVDKKGATYYGGDAITRGKELDLPHPVIMWAGLDGQTFAADPQIRDRNLSGLNDQQRLGFEEIAQLIEENL